MSTQPVEDALNDEQRRIRQQGPNGEQRKILEDTMNNPTSALKDADSFVEGVLAYQMRVDYKKRAWALRDGCGAGAGAGRNSSELAEHLVLSDELGKRDKNFLRVFEQVSPVTVRHWFQQMGTLSCSSTPRPILTFTSLRRPWVNIELGYRKRSEFTSLFYYSSAYAYHAI
jgi:hypothetical protein